MDEAPLSVGDFGPAVADLHRMLISSGLEVAATEVSRSFFGPSTREAVHEYQRRLGPPPPPTGVVDAATRAATATATGPASTSTVRLPAPVVSALASPPGSPIGEPVDSPSLHPKRPEDQPRDGLFVVRGRVLHADGTPASQAFVRVVDRDPHGERDLGKAETASDGTYLIHYSADQVRRAAKVRADLVVRVLDVDGHELAASPTRFDAGPDETINLAIGNVPYRGPSEFAMLLGTMTPKEGDMRVDTGLPYNRRRTYRLIGQSLYSAPAGGSIRGQAYVLEQADVIRAELERLPLRVVVREGRIWIESSGGDEPNEELP
jgi:hypothetical protein